MFLLQPPGLVVYLVPEPSQVHPLHPLEKLQVDHHQSHSLCPACTHFGTFLLLHAWLHRQEDDGCMIRASFFSTLPQTCKITCVHGIQHCEIFLYFQSPRLVFHLVPEPAEVHSLHSVAQLQVGDSQSDSVHASGHYHSAVLLFHAWVHGQENDGSLDLVKSVRSTVRSKLISWLQ